MANEPAAVLKVVGGTDVQSPVSRADVEVAPTEVLGTAATVIYPYPLYFPFVTEDAEGDRVTAYFKLFEDASKRLTYLYEAENDTNMSKYKLTTRHGNDPQLVALYLVSVGFLTLLVREFAPSFALIAFVFFAGLGAGITGLILHRQRHHD